MIVTRELYNACLDGATIAATFDDVTGEISRIAWDVKTGVLEIRGIAPSPVVAIAGDSGFLALGAGSDASEAQTA